MKFVYQARDAKGVLQRGEVRALDKASAERLLTDSGLIIVSFTQISEKSWIEYIPFVVGISNKDLVLFSRQLATLVGAQMPIVRSLRILESQMTNDRFAVIVRELAVAIENGESFSAALSKRPDVFGPIYISLVKSGEISGTLNRALNYLADQLEKDYQFKAKVRSALVYPAFVIFTLVSVGLLMFKFVLPKLTSLLSEQGGELPFVTKIIISITNFIDAFWWLVIFLLIALSFALHLFVKTQPGRYIWDALKLKLPVVKAVVVQLYQARFARNLSTLVSGGIPIIQALQSIADVVGNVHYQEALRDAALKVSTGKTVSEALSLHEEFPTVVTKMVQVGEQSGQLSEILEKLAVFYEKEVEEQVSSLTSLIEPIIMIVLGIGVGGLVAGVLLPIYNLASSIG